VTCVAALTDSSRYFEAGLARGSRWRLCDRAVTTVAVALGMALDLEKTPVVAHPRITTVSILEGFWSGGGN